MNKENLGEKVWNRWPMVSVYVDPEVKDGIDLSAIKIPAGVKFIEVAELAARYREALASTAQDVRGWTCGELAALDPYDAASLDAVTKMLKDPVPWVRLNVAGALPTFINAKSALPALREAVKDAGNDAQLKESLEKAITTIGQAPAEDERPVGFGGGGFVRGVARHRRSISFRIGQK
jgi:hypothetical protein